MKRLWKSFTLAFSMYSRIPMPYTDWDEESMSYVFCFCPLIGVVIGALELLWFFLADLLAMEGLLFAAVAVVIPLLLTGGIHMDGFCDTCDALASHQSREKKLEILKDSHVGAFAVIGCCAWFLLDAGLWSGVEATGRTVLVLALIPVLSRVLSGLCAVTMRNARGTGLLATFVNGSSRRTTRTVLVLWLVVTGMAMAAASPLNGLAALLGAGLALLLYVHMSRSRFGGITGDLEGWFLQMCELLSLAAVVLAEKVSGIL